MSAGTPTLGRLLSALPRRALQRIEAVASFLYRPAFSVLSVHSDLAGWVLYQEALEIAQIARRLGLRAHLDLGISPRVSQCVHYTSQFVLEAPRTFESRNRISLDYFHGRPDTPDFIPVFDGLRRHHAALWRLRVSHSEIEALVLDSGIDPGKVHRIPIGVNLSYFPPRTVEARMRLRQQLGIPPHAKVVGSFQKDGVGWGHGFEPKLVKGPDVLLTALGILHERVPDLWVFLTGAARGYVKQGLERLGVPYRHVRFRSYARAAQCFQALDAYLVPSREEGGPKAVLESMASRVPLITTRVGQAMDLVQHDVNGWIVPVEDAAGLAHYAETALTDPGAAARVVATARQTAEENSYEALAPRWSRFFNGFVECE